MAEWLFRLLRRNTEQLTPRRRRQVITARALGAAFAASDLIVAAACLSGGAVGFGLSVLPLTAVYTLPLWSSSGARIAVRMAPLIGATLAALVVSWTAGSDSGAHICLFMLACWPFAIFDVETERAAILTLLLLGGGIFVGVELSFAPNGSPATSNGVPINEILRPILVTCSFVFFAAVLFNITKQNQKQEDDLLSQAESLRQASAVAEAALRTRTQFLAMMSHEFRTPLNGILGPTQVLASTTLSTEQREQVELLRYSGEYMLCLVSDLLEHANAKAQPLQLLLEPLDLVALCEHAVAARRAAAATKGLTITKKLPTSGVWVEADGGRLAQLLHELLGNAIKFTQRGDVTLELCAGVVTPDGLIETTLSVSDTGCGMDGDVQSRLFKEFQQGAEFDARTADGLGLGLFRVRRIVERMGGNVEVLSTLGEGSTFRVRLTLKSAARSEAKYAPLAEATAERKEISSDGPIEAVRVMHEGAPSSPRETQLSVRVEWDTSPSVDSGVQAKAHSASQLKVLVAEDNPVNQQILVKLLAKLECVPTIVGDGARAVEAFKREPWDLILMDIQMPNMDGLEATREIRRLEGDQSHVKIVAVTANANPDQVEAGLHSGLDVYLTKPIRLGVLAEVINKQRSLAKVAKAAS